MESSDGEDVKLAIALSLQNDTKEVIDLDSDVDEISPNVPQTGQNPRHFVSTSSLLGIDRKQMEQERLARKRKRSTSPPAATRFPKRMEKDYSQPSKQGSQSSSIKAAANTQPERHTSSDECLYFSGAVKKTWAFGHQRTGNDIKLEEILQKTDLKLAVLSSFQWDIEWLLAKINPNTQTTLVMQAKDQSTRQQYTHETSSTPNLRLCFPPMDGQINCMHSKLMLLSHPTYLRILVPTANLVPYDWGVSGDMENMVFLIDLPRLPKDSPAQQLPPFGRELVRFLEAMGLERSILESVSGFDFTATQNFAFVHTIGGAHMGDDEPWRRTGYPGLGQAVRELGLATPSTLNIDFITSSIGSLTIDFLTTLYLAAQGDDGHTEYSWRNPETTGKAKTKSSKAETEQISAHQQRIKNEVTEKFKIYYPTHDTVKVSKAGYAGTICFQSKWYNSPTFPRHALVDCKSSRKGLLMHNKIIYVRPKPTTNIPPTTPTPPTSWAYIGSANCSESAWGKLSRDRVTKTPKLNCRNWECGVIVPVGRDGNGTVKGEDGLAFFEGTVPVPMVFPGETYGEMRPWFYSEE